MLRILLFVALVVIIVMVVVGVSRAQRAVSGRTESYLASPEGRHAHAVAEARRQLRRAEKVYAKRVRRAEKALTEAGRDITIVKVGQVVLGSCTITVKGGVHELSPVTTFTVAVEGEIRSVITQKGDRQEVTHEDQREIYLTITDDIWADVVRLGADKLEGARRLEAAGAAAVRNLPAARSARDHRTQEAQRELEQVLADTAEIEAAQMTLEDLEGVGPRPIDIPEPPASGDGWDDEDDDCRGPGQRPA